MKVLLFLPSTPLRGFYKPGLFAKNSQTSLPWQKRTAKVSQVSCSKEVSLIFAYITEEKVTFRKIGHKISARAPCNFTARFSSLSLRKRLDRPAPCKQKPLHVQVWTQTKTRKPHFHVSRGQRIQTGHVKSSQGRTLYGAERPSRLACPNQASERQASFHFPHVSCAEPRPGHADQF